MSLSLSLNGRDISSGPLSLPLKTVPRTPSSFDGALSLVPCVQVRSMRDSLGSVTAASPSFAVQMVGLNALPVAGDDFVVCASDSEVRASSAWLGLVAPCGFASAACFWSDCTPQTAPPHFYGTDRLYPCARTVAMLRHDAAAQLVRRASPESQKCSCHAQSLQHIVLDAWKAGMCQLFGAVVDGSLLDFRLIRLKHRLVLEMCRRARRQLRWRARSVSHGCWPSPPLQW